MSIKEATDTVMATLGAYDALWDGVLTPEIVDAEYYDWDDDPRHPFILTRIVKMPIPLKYHSYPPFMEGLARNEALDVLMATLGEYDTLWDGELIPEIVDAEFYDCFDDSIFNSPFKRVVKLPVRLLYQQEPRLLQKIARFEAIDVLKAVVKALVDNIPGVVKTVNKTGFVVSLLPCALNYDGIHYDYPIVWTDRHERANILFKLSQIGVEHTAQCEARDALIATVSALGLAYIDAPLMELNLEGVLTDCPFDGPSDNLVLFGTIK